MPKLHTNQFYSIGGVKAAVDCGAISVDHLEVMTTADIEVLKNVFDFPLQYDTKRHQASQQIHLVWLKNQTLATVDDSAMRSND